MLADRDLADLHGHPARFFDAAGADEAGHRRRRRHRAPAESDRLDDCAVAHVGVGVVRSEAREVEADRCQHRRREPAIPESGDTNAEVRAVAGHHRHERRAGDAGRRIRQRFPRGHRDVQEELIVAGDERRQPRVSGSVARDLRERLHQRARQQRGRGDVSLVHLVAHPDGLRHERAKVDAAGLAERRAEKRPGFRREPAEARDDGVVRRAEPQHFAEPFVDRRAGSVAVASVLDDEDGHGARDDSGHRADGARVMTRLQPDVAAIDQASGLRILGGPALVAHGAQHCGAHRLARAVPFERRSGVEHDAIAEAERLVRRDAIDQDRLAVDQAVERDGVGAIDPFAAGLEPGEESHDAEIATGGRLPVEMGDGNAEPIECFRKEREPDVDHADVFAEWRRARTPFGILEGRVRHRWSRSLTSSPRAALADQRREAGGLGIRRHYGDTAPAQCRDLRGA